MIVDLDHEASLDPVRVGSKAARLALGRRSGLPLLPGIVVETLASRRHMELGARALAGRGSGGARLAVIGEAILFADELVERALRVGPRLVARSSTLLEASGEWSGAFTSYLDLSPAEVPKAVAGCWASAFSVASLERLQASSIEPGSFPMAVLIQPALDPAAGGTAIIAPDGTVTVHGVKGSPAPLLQGWSNGDVARRRVDGSWAGGELVHLLGTTALDDIEVSIREAQQRTGANRCEWALDDRVWLLQLDYDVRPAPEPATLTFGNGAEADLVALARIVSRASGPVGDRLVLPWGLAGLPETFPTIRELPADALAGAQDMCARLAAEVWEMPAAQASIAADECISGLLGTDPGPALERIRRLRPPDPDLSAHLLAIVEALERDDPAARRGVGRWEPFLASVVLSAGAPHHGTPASPGVGAGLQSRIEPGTENGLVPRRSVVSATQPLPNLASLLWDAAALVTATGSPAAHLFESARALGIPAVCGVELPTEEQLVAVDGHNGVVATIALYGDEHV